MLLISILRPINFTEIFKFLIEKNEETKEVEVQLELELLDEIIDKIIETTVVVTLKHKKIGFI